MLGEQMIAEIWDIFEISDVQEVWTGITSDHRETYLCDSVADGWLCSLVPDDFPVEQVLRTYQAECSVRWLDSIGKVQEYDCKYSDGTADKWIVFEQSPGKWMCIELAAPPAVSTPRPLDNPAVSLGELGEYRVNFDMARAQTGAVSTPRCPKCGHDDLGVCAAGDIVISCNGGDTPETCCTYMLILRRGEKISEREYREVRNLRDFAQFFQPVSQPSPVCPKCSSSNIYGVGGFECGDCEAEFIAPAQPSPEGESKP